MSGIFSVDRHMHDRADAAARDALAANIAHQLVVADGDLFSVHARNHALAADFPHIGYTLGIRLFPIGSDQTAADRVGGIGLGMRRISNELFVLQRRMVHAADLKASLRQRAGLIHHDRPHLG